MLGPSRVMNSWRMRFRLLAAALAVLSALGRPAVAAEQSADEIVQMVRGRLTAIYAPVKTIQAKVMAVYLTPDAKEQKAKPPADGDQDEGARLTFTIQARMKRSWDVTIAGANERYEEQRSGTKGTTILRRGDIELDYVHGE